VLAIHKLDPKAHVALREAEDGKRAISPGAIFYVNLPSLQGVMFLVIVEF
jgi:hypothetical protein